MPGQLPAALGAHDTPGCQVDHTVDPLGLLAGYHRVAYEGAVEYGGEGLRVVKLDAHAQAKALVNCPVAGIVQVQLQHLLVKAVVVVVHHGADQARLGTEVAVHHALYHSGLARDLGQFDVPLGGHSLLHRHGEQPLASGLAFGSGGDLDDSHGRYCISFPK